MEFNGVRLQYEQLSEEIESAVAGVLSSGRYILGPTLEAFEEEFARYCHGGSGIGVACGTDALRIALVAAGVEAGDEVLVPALTVAATAMVVMQLKAVPVFVDVDPGDFTMDPADAMEKRSSRTRAVIPVHLYGMPARLKDWGYKVSTGPLVWNRHKDQLRSHPAKSAYPLIWAEAIAGPGHFVFRAQKKNHEPYFELRPGDSWLTIDEPCVLLQRTTAKEQSRRLIAAELPASFVRDHGWVVIENHLNMIRPLNGAPEISPAAVAALLNTEIVNDAFRCISGSVAVSAFELEALPLPSPEQGRTLDALLAHGGDWTAIEAAVRSMYLA